jgi:uncharacterized membrane protein
MAIMPSLLTSGSRLASKALPLPITLTGVVRGKLYTYRWITLLVILYFVEGAVRAYSDRGLSAQLALIEIALTMIIFASAVAYVRMAQKTQ